MTGVVPPTIEKPKTVIGVGMRELLILGAGLVLGLLVIVSGLSLIPKVAVTALIVGLAALLALGRAPTTGKTFEEHFLDILRFYGRGRFLQRGTSTEKEVRREVEQPVYRASDIEKVFEKEAAKGVVKVRPLPLSWSGLLGVVSLSFLLALLAWMWGGGLEGLLVQLGLSR
ncbi:MAG: hypothetical protein FJZ97_14380 [Chloroflexi bacterium]|jgi:hypothetical protein|nr:hypothetical protein [Chloroflexota bacterium]